MNVTKIFYLTTLLLCSLYFSGCQGEIEANIGADSSKIKNNGSNTTPCEAASFTGLDSIENISIKLQEVRGLKQK